MARTLKALSALLSYPDADLASAAPSLGAAIGREGVLTGEARRMIDPLIAELATGDLIEMQERYVDLFDRTRSLSLHLFEHVHGESRDRGQAMIDLAGLYEQHGLLIDTSELPDHLPLFLEFLSILPLDEACDLLGQTAHVLAAIGARLARRKSSYAAVFDALVVLSATKPDRELVAALLDGPDQAPTDFAALDAAWEDEPVTFGPGDGGGCKDGLIARLRAARRPSPN
ncbi:MAG: nitrate reductase molybdenum cofactor assembly chaperone [Bauldia sp.]|nr:nitrate reductase molybdenum cofactor assembly chaperone [Bauldia sp.]